MEEQLEKKCQQHLQLKQDTKKTLDTVPHEELLRWFMEESDSDGDSEA